MSTEMWNVIGNPNRFKESWRASLFTLIRKGREEYLKYVINHNVEPYLRERRRQKETYYTIWSHINFVGQCIFYVTPHARRRLNEYLRNAIKTAAQKIKSDARDAREAKALEAKR